MVSLDLDLKSGAVGLSHSSCFNQYQLSIVGFGMCILIGVYGEVNNKIHMA